MYKFFRREIVGVQEIVLSGISRISFAGFFKAEAITYFFLIGLAFKLFAGAFLSSAFLSGLFIPFVNYFIESGFTNPYVNFNQSSEVVSFPYPALMLYIVMLPKLLFGWIAPKSVLFNLFLCRVPVLIADLGIFYILKSWLREKFHKRLVYFYWLSPVLFYISYVHGQLDAIPIALLFCSLFFLFKDRYLCSALLFGCALSAKTNVLIVFPFFFLFMLSKRVSFQTLLKFFTLVVLSFVVINIPFIGDRAFFDTVFFNHEYLKLFNAHISINGLSLYLLPASLLILFVKGVLLKHYNKDIFMMLLGFGFSIVLLFIPPMQGWYFWLMPFLSYFYIKKNGRSHLIYVSLSASYMLYFFVVKESDYLGVFEFILPNIAQGKNFYYHFAGLGWNVDKLVSLVYTGLQTTMLVNCFWIYKEGLESYRKDKIIASPFLVGIGGNSGVGKTTISEALSRVFGSYNTAILRGDDMHKWRRSHKMWTELTHLDPRANYLHKEVNYLKTLKSGQKILRRHYDHSTGEFTAEKPLKPNNLVVYEGLHPFFLPSQRRLYDLKIFINPSTELMYHWKIVRDRKKRGYSKDKVLESIKKRENDSAKYIDTQKNKAEFIIEAHTEEPIRNIGDESEKVEVYYKLKLSNIVYLEPLIDDLSEVEGLNIKHWYTEDDHQEVDLRGELSPDNDIEKICREHINGLEDLGVENPDWPEGLFGVLVLLLSHYILEKSRL